ILPKQTNSTLILIVFLLIIHEWLPNPLAYPHLLAPWHKQARYEWRHHNTKRAIVLMLRRPQEAPVAKSHNCLIAPHGSHKCQYAANTALWAQRLRWVLALEIHHAAKEWERG